MNRKLCDLVDSDVGVSCNDLVDSDIGVSFNGLFSEVRFLYGLQEWIYCVYNVCIPCNAACAKV